MEGATRINRLSVCHNFEDEKKISLILDGRDQCLTVLDRKTVATVFLFCYCQNFLFGEIIQFG